MAARVTLDVQASAEALFDYLADPRNRPQWQSSLRGIEMLTAGEPGVGSRWRDLTTARLEPTMEITEWDRPRRWVERGTWRGIEAWLTLEFHERGADRCRLLADFELRGRGPWRPVAAVAGRLGSPAVRSDLRRAARLVAELGG